MQLMTGFGQVATESEVKKYFIEGKELSKKIVSNLSDLLLQSDTQPPSTWADTATDSTESPFTEINLQNLDKTINMTTTNLN